jgi:hypothetical protein
MNIDQILSALRSERDRLDSAIRALEGSRGARTSGGSARANGRRKRHLTPEGRRRLSEMMKKRWAERRKKSAA